MSPANLNRSRKSQRLGKKSHRLGKKSQPMGFFWESHCVYLKKRLVTSECSRFVIGVILPVCNDNVVKEFQPHYFTGPFHALCQVVVTFARMDAS